MQVDEIRKVFRSKPFRPIEIRLENGEVHRIPSPEVVITDHLVMTIDRNGEAVLFGPESVSSIRQIGRRPTRRQGPAAGS